ncbi:MAG: TylF/MycF family methyltransferase [Prevotellaceae bacterium]|nr:TylF/MycF family methyltransferase [Prevotellaceae bacterium]
MYNKKGYFSETTNGISENFCFVNLDFDLYQPILSRIEYFYPRMVKGGVILIHDYFSERYNGVKDAVREFDKRNKLNIFPIGDRISIGINC